MTRFSDLLLGIRLPVFTRRARRAVMTHPKFYFFDAGVFRSLRPRGPLDIGNGMDGPALEGLVLQHVRAWRAYGNRDLLLSYWRTRGGSEVDFVLYGEEGFWGIEVKNARTVNAGDVRPLRAFRDEYPESTVFLLYRGKDRLRIRDVLCIPFPRHPGVRGFHNGEHLRKLHLHGGASAGPGRRPRSDGHEERTRVLPFLYDWYMATAKEHPVAFLQIGGDLIAIEVKTGVAEAVPQSLVAFVRRKHARGVLLAENVLPDIQTEEAISHHFLSAFPENPAVILEKSPG